MAHPTFLCDNIYVKPLLRPLITALITKIDRDNDYKQGSFKMHIGKRGKNNFSNNFISNYK